MTLVPLPKPPECFSLGFLDALHLTILTDSQQRTIPFLTLGPRSSSFSRTTQSKIQLSRLWNFRHDSLYAKWRPL